MTEKEREMEGVSEKARVSEREPELEIVEKVVPVQEILVKARVFQRA